MAVTKVYAVRTHLHRIVSYAANEQKTELGGIIEYAVNPDKTEKRLFECAINCRSVSTAYEEMQATKFRWNKHNGVLAYHFIQSFAPGETTPEQAHNIGKNFAKQCFGDRFEVVIGTHLDKKHLHNHIVVNSVSFVDGGKYHSSPESYYNTIRVISDKLCAENNLSIITPQGKGKHYAEWKAEKEGKPTVRSMLRQEVDQIIRDSYNFKTFLELLQKRGYTVKYGDRVKHMAVKPPYSEKYIRLKSLGDNYTEEFIKLRLEVQRKGIRPLDTAQRKLSKRYRVVKGTFSFFMPKKIKGFAALYLRYLYLLGKVRKRKIPNKSSFVLREEVLKFERYQRQFRFLHTNQIATGADLLHKKAAIEDEISGLITRRNSLYTEKNTADTEENKAAVQAQITAINTSLGELRKQKGLCDSIEKDIHIITQKFRQTDALAENISIEKEEQNYEHKR